MAEVIPRQYLESDADNATFAYNGKEYGFYVVKSRSFFDVLLIDFSYEFPENDQIHTSDLEYVIRIKPILQQGFWREKSGNTYTWKKFQSDRRYYVANPRFLTVVRNENSLNYGDDGYDKLQDEGVMISQTRLNYGKISYATESDLTKYVVDFTIKKATSELRDAVAKVIDKVTESKVGTAINWLIELSEDLYDAGKEETIKVDNESNIRTGISREQQRTDKNIPSYLRMVAVQPEQEVVLSEAGDSYAELITVVDDANSRTRLDQFCVFDIFYRDSDYASMESVKTDCEVSKERIIYDDKSVTPLSDEITQDKYIYLLKDGEHRFSYQCNDTTSYRFVFNGQLPEVSITSDGESVEASEVNGNAYEVVFEKGKNYRITFSGLPAGIHNFNFCKKIENIDSFGERDIGNLAVGESRWFEYTPQKDTYLSIDCDTDKYGVYVYNSVNGENPKVNRCANHTEFLALANQKYYVQIANDTLAELSSGKVTFDNVAELDLDKTVEIAVDGERTYRFNAPMYGRYKIVDLPSGISASFNSNSLGDAYLLPQGEQYVTFYGRIAYGTCKICFDSTDIFVRGGESFSISGNAPCAILKIKARQTLDYSLTVPNNARLTKTFCDGVVTDVDDAQSVRFEKDKVYYLLLQSKNGDLPAVLNISIEPESACKITANSDGDEEVTLNYTGTCVIEVEINEDNYYGFGGADAYVLYDSVLDEVGEDSLLIVGTYYLKTTLNGESVIKISREGLPMNISDTLVVNKSGTFKYDVVKGEKYEVRIGKNSADTFTANILVKNSVGQDCEVIKNGEVYSFVAEDSVVYVKLTIENNEGQAGIFFVNKANVKQESSVQTIRPEQVYSFAVSDNRFIRIPAGDFSLYVSKSIRDSVRLYEMKDEETKEAVTEVTTIKQDSALKFNLSATEETVYLLTSDHDSVDFMLLYSQSGAYKVLAENYEQDTDTLYTNVSYKFNLYRVLNGKKTIVANVDESDIEVQDKAQRKISPVNGKYLFTDNGVITVSVHYWGITAQISYVVEEPQIDLSVSDTDGKVIFNAAAADVGSAYLLKSVTLSLYANGAKVAEQKYYSSAVKFNADDYIWNKNLTLKAEYVYTYGDETLTIEDQTSYNVACGKINDTVSFGSNAVYLLDGTSFSGSMTKTVTIPSTVKSVYFLGKNNLTVRYLDIKIQDRSSELNLFMKDFNYIFKTYGIYSDTSTIRLGITGSCSIKPETEKTVGRYGIYARNLEIYGSGKLGVTSGKRESADTYDLLTGYAGICANNLTVKVNELFVRGGAGGDAINAVGTQYADDLRGKNGELGGLGGYAIWLTTDLVVTSPCQKITMKGGDGGDGGNGADGLNATKNAVKGGRGGNGGDGGDPGASYYRNVAQSTLYFAPNVTVVEETGIAGNGGKGGNGGSGGRGGKGGNGGSGGSGYIGGLGGNGGAGGKGLDDTSTSAKSTDGGDGGNGGKGGYSYSTGLYEKPGNGANGGDGGDPGKFGGGMRGGKGGYGYNGGKGGNGSSGHIMFAAGGSAGNGGDAYGGTPGNHGTAGKGVAASNGSSGANGKSYKSYQDYPEDNT